MLVTEMSFVTCKKGPLLPWLAPPSQILGRPTNIGGGSIETSPSGAFSSLGLTPLLRTIVAPIPNANGPHPGQATASVLGSILTLEHFTLSIDNLTLLVQATTKPTPALTHKY